MGGLKTLSYLSLVSSSLSKLPCLLSSSSRVAVTSSSFCVGGFREIGGVTPNVLLENTSESAVCYLSRWSANLVDAVVDILGRTVRQIPDSDARYKLIVQ